MLKKLRILMAIMLVLVVCVSSVGTQEIQAAKQTTVKSTKTKEDAKTIKVGKSYKVKLSTDGEDTFVKFKLSSESYVKVTAKTSTTGKLGISIGSDDYIIIGCYAICEGYRGAEYATKEINTKDGKLKLPKGTYYLRLKSEDGREDYKGKVAAPKTVSIKVSKLK